MAIVDRSSARTKIKSLSGDLSIVVVTHTFDSSYAAGGEAIGLLDEPDIREVVAATPGFQGGYVFKYDKATDSLLAFYGNYDAADGPLIEVANAVNVGAAGAVTFVAYVR